MIARFHELDEHAQAVRAAAQAAHGLVQDVVHDDHVGPDPIEECVVREHGGRRASELDEHVHRLRGHADPVDLVTGRIDVPTRQPDS